MTLVMGVDPGEHTGLALFSKGWLTWARVKTFKTLTGIDFVTDTVVIEIPRIYPHSSKGDPNDIVELALKAGEIRGVVKQWTKDIIQVWPKTWKGSVKKEIHNARVLKALTAEELSVLPTCKKTKTNPTGFDNNMVDAIGLGLWHLKRM